MVPLRRVGVYRKSGGNGSKNWDASQNPLPIAFAWHLARLLGLGGLFAIPATLPLGRMFLSAVVHDSFNQQKNNYSLGRAARPFENNRSVAEGVSIFRVTDVTHLPLSTVCVRVRDGYYSRTRHICHQTDASKNSARSGFMSR